MIDRDDLPETPEWTSPIKAWDEQLCCSICDAAIQAAWRHNHPLPKNVILGEN